MGTIITNHEIFELKPDNASEVFKVPVTTVAVKLKIASAPSGSGAEIIVIIVAINIISKCHPSSGIPTGLNFHKIAASTVSIINTFGTFFKILSILCKKIYLLYNLVIFKLKLPDSIMIFFCPPDDSSKPFFISSTKVCSLIYSTQFSIL